MVTIKDICKSLITPRNYKSDTKELTVEVYQQYGIVLGRTSGTDLLFGTPKVPKLMSVIRRIQMAKKAMKKQIQIAAQRQSKKVTPPSHIDKSLW